MKLISNAEYGEPIESGTIFRITENGFNMSIHKICGCGDTWYLNCLELGIKDLPLANRNIFGCVKDSMEIIKNRIDTLNVRFNSLYEDTVIEISRY